MLDKQILLLIKQQVNCNNLELIIGSGSGSVG
jgi:hypothetical protein